MPTFKLPDSELTDMRQFYEDELEKTIKRLQHIKNVMDQLGGNSPTIDIKIKNKNVPKSAKALVKKSKPVGRPKSAKKRPGRKSFWDALILRRMKQIDKPMTYDELTEDIMKFSNLPEAKRLSTKQAILNVTFRMRTRDNMINTFSMGSREKFLALNTWFESKGKIKKEYASKISGATQIKSTSKPVKKAKAKIRKNKKRKPAATKKAAVKSSAPKAAAIKTTAKVGRPKGTAKKSTAKVGRPKGTAKKTAVKIARPKAAIKKTRAKRTSPKAVTKSASSTTEVTSPATEDKSNSPATS